MNKENKHILHLLSWYPTPNDPTRGNFCLRHIEAISLSCNSIVLIVYTDANINKNRELNTETVDNYTKITIQIKPFLSLFRPLNTLINKYKLFIAYNFGLKHIRKQHFNPDLVHLHVALPLGKIALYWKKRFKIPYVLSEHWSIYSPDDKRLKDQKIKKRLLKIAKNASAVTAVSQLLKKNMLSFGIKNNIHVIPNTIDINLFHSIPKKQLPKKHILHISSLNNQEKNFSGILNVINRLKETRNDFVLNVIHDYDYEEYQSFITKNQLSEYIIFHGKKTMEEIVTYYQSADFLLMFSNFETFSCVVMEALACGIPVVATNTGAIPEMLGNNRGFIVSPKDEEALFQKVNKMLDVYSTFSPEDLRQFIQKNYNQKTISTMFCQLYQQLLNHA